MQPEPLSIKMGCPPTALNARTGLFTPPGINCCAAWNNSMDLSLFMASPFRYASVSGVAATFRLRPCSLGTQTKVCDYNLHHPSPRDYPLSQFSSCSRLSKDGRI